MTDKLEDTSLRLKDEMDLYRKMMDKLWQNRHEFQKEREAMQEVAQRMSFCRLQLYTYINLNIQTSHTIHMCMQLIEDLRRELEHLQLFKLETEKPGRGRSAAGLSEYNAKTREIELEHEAKRLKQVQWKDMAVLIVLSVICFLTVSLLLKQVHDCFYDTQYSVLILCILYINCQAPKNTSQKWLMQYKEI